ncbi:MAG: secondary thiamine-phosphate synthase enzyme YjbQ [Thermoplasmatota archaeon]
MRKTSMETHRRQQMAGITERVQAAVEAAGIEQGLAVVYAPHTTAGIMVNEGTDPHVERDILATLAQLVPTDGSYAHAEGNSDAHVKATLVGNSVTLMVNEGRLALGTWQRLFLFEGDGPRRRRVWVEVVNSRP